MSRQIGFHHVALRVRDFDKSVGFYQSVLGCTPTVAWGEAPSRAIMLDYGGGNYIELFEKPAEPSLPADQLTTQPSAAAILHVCLRTNDVDGIISKVRDAGCNVLLEPKDTRIPDTITGDPLPVRLAFFSGPDGETIELFKNERT